MFATAAFTEAVDETSQATASRAARPRIEAVDCARPRVTSVDAMSNPDSASATAHA
jgi:hypothetical protein